MAAWVGPLIAAGGQIISGILSRRGSRDQNTSNVAEAEANRAWQERMSSTAHQRQVKDLRAAGLNPILSATLGGAGTGAGAQAQHVNELSGMANSARQIAREFAQVRQINAQTQKINAEKRFIDNKTRISNMAGSVADDATSVYNAAKDMLQNEHLKDDVSGMMLNSGKTIQRIKDKIEQEVKEKLEDLKRPFKKANKDQVKWQIDRLKKMKFSDTSKRWYRLSNGKWYDLKHHKVVDVRSK